MREIEKARRYEAMAPGVDIPVEQKAERFDRKRSLKLHGLPSRRRRTLVGSVVVGGNVWCDCGKFKHEGDCA